MKPTQAVTLDVFQELLRTSNLLAAEELTQLERDCAAGSFRDAQQFARRLVERKLITRWQAQVMLAGKNRFFFGKYRLLERLGAGGMGTVFKAQQMGLGRIVALKVMADALLEDEQAVARFHREIRSVASLEHPHIVATFDAGNVGGKHFLVMEYVDGENLQAVAKRRGRLPVAEACEYIRQAALGLAHAHERGMIHRDIKPANLLLASPPLNSRFPPLSKERPGGVALPASDSPALPVVKILDFGLARLANETQGDTALTQTGQIMGTPDYIAPEQARDTKAADIRSDIYSLGCTLFRLLAGEVPFPGQSVMEKLMARALGEAPRVRMLQPAVPKELDDCLARMIARDPAARLQTPGEVAVAMAAFAAGAAPPETAPPVSEETLFPTASLAHAGGWIPDPLRDPDPGVENFLAVLATEAEEEAGFAEGADDTARSGGLSGSSGSTRVDAVAPPTTDSRAARRLTTSSQRLMAKDRRQPYVALGSLVAVLLVVSGLWLWQRSGMTRLDIDWPDAERKGATLEIDGREPVLAGNLSFSGPAGRRTLRITRKGYEPIAEEWQLTRGEAVSYRPVWKLTALAARRREFAPLKTEIDRLGSPFSGSFARKMSPEIVELRGKGDDFIRRWLDTPEARVIAAALRPLPAPVDELRRETISQVELRHSGNGDPRAAPAELVAVIGDSRLKHGTKPLAIAFSPDDAWLAAGDDRGFVRIWDTATGQVVRVIPAHAAAVFGLAFGPDGKTLLTGSIDATAKLWDLESFGERHILTGHKEQVRAVAFSPQGDLVATAGLEKFIKLWSPADGSLVHTFPEDVVYYASLAFSPDGRSLAVGCGEPFTAFVLNVTDGTRRYTLPGHEQAVLSVAWSPDGSKLATGCADMKTRLWEAASGKPIRTTFAGQQAGIAAVAFAADGRTVAAACHDGTIDLRNIESGEVDSTIATHEAGLLHMAASHRGRRLATAGHDQTIRFWDAKTGKETLKVAPRIRCLAASPDGRWLALGNEDGTTDLWDIATGRRHATLAGMRSWPAALAFSPDARLLAVGGNGNDTTIRVWDVESQNKLHVIDAHAGLISGLAFTPDARMFVSSGSDGLIKTWNVETGLNAAVMDAKSGGISCLALSTDGRIVVAAHARHLAEPEIKFWDLASRKETKTVAGPWHHIVALAFGPDDKALAVGHSQQGVRLHDLSKGTDGEFLYGTGMLAFDPHTGWLAVETMSGIALYDPEFITPIAEFSRGSADVQAAQLLFTPEGRHLAMLTSSGTVQILRLPAANE